MSLRLILFALVGLLQILLPGRSIWVRQQTLSHGRLWKFRAEPVDPVDAVRGRYVTLAFDAEKVPQSEALPPSADVYALLKEGTDGFAVVDRLSRTSVSGDNVIKVTTNGFYDGVERVEFPFKRFWLAEKIAPRAEEAYQTNSRKDKRNAYATVRIRAGDAAVEQLYVGDLPLAEFIQQNPPK